MSGTPELLAEFTGLYERLGRAVAERDQTSLLGMLDEDYVFTSPDGARMNYRTVVELEMQIPPPEDVAVIAVQEVTDDVVIVRGHDLVRGDFPAGAISSELAAQMVVGVRITFTAVWRRRAGVWRAVSNDAHVDASFSA